MAPPKGKKKIRRPIADRLRELEDRKRKLEQQAKRKELEFALDNLSEDDGKVYRLLKRNSNTMNRAIEIFQEEGENAAAKVAKGIQQGIEDSMMKLLEQAAEDIKSGKVKAAPKKKAKVVEEEEEDEDEDEDEDDED